MLPLLVLPLLPLPAQAQDAATVLISAFKGQDAASVPVAMSMPNLLEAALATQSDIELMRLDQAPPIHEQQASLYMDACPDERVSGCTFVVGEAAGAAFALTGTVTRHVEQQPLTEGADPPSPEMLVQLQILDIDQMHEALSVELVYTADTADSFSDAVPSMLSDVVEGWVGQVVDIRDLELDEDPDAYLGREEAARELSALEGELGEVEGTRTHGDLTTAPRREERAGISHSELLARYESKRNPWDEMGLTSREYLAWWNSGWDYNSWSRRFDGRKGQVLLRAHGGWGIKAARG